MQDPTSLQSMPENLHFPDTLGIKLQSKAFLSEGELGEPGSIYAFECVITEVKTGVVCYDASGSFFL